MTTSRTALRGALLLTGLLLFGCGGPEDTLEGSDDAIIVVPPCFSSPDATIDVLPGTTDRVITADSNGIAYAQDCAPRYTADINMYGPYDRLVAFKGGGQQAVADAECATTSLTFIVHRREYSFTTGKWTAWRTVESETIESGQVSPYSNGCNTNYLEQGLWVKAAAGTIQQVRVQVLPEQNGIARPARVTWYW